MRILITGAAGFIGSHLADRFITDGHTVVGLDNFTTGRRENVNNAVHMYHQDVRNIPQVTAAAGSPDLIVHCAASYADPDKWHRDTETNVIGTINTVLEARLHECPLVYMQTALPPVSSYAISKTAGMQYIQQSGVPHLIFRLANIYGPRNLSGPIPTFAKRLMEGEMCTATDTGRDFVYIDDLVECVMSALAGMNAGIYDVCAGVETPIIWLYEAVEHALGVKQMARLVPPPLADVKTELSVDARLPGWNPTTMMSIAIERTVSWYRDNPPSQTFTHLRMEEPARV